LHAPPDRLPLRLRRGLAVEQRIVVVVTRDTDAAGRPGVIHWTSEVPHELPPGKAGARTDNTPFCGVGCVDYL
jgi:hypothetical protein